MSETICLEATPCESQAHHYCHHLHCRLIQMPEFRPQSYNVFTFNLSPTINLPLHSRSGRVLVCSDLVQCSMAWGVSQGQGGSWGFGHTCTCRYAAVEDLLAGMGRIECAMTSQVRNTSGDACLHKASSCLLAAVVCWQLSAGSCLLAAVVLWQLSSGNCTMIRGVISTRAKAVLLAEEL